MGRVRLEIDYDSDAKTASVSVNGGEQHHFTEASLAIESDVDEELDAGWLVRKVTSTRLLFSAERSNA